MSSETPISLPVLNISDPTDPVVGKAMLDAATKYGFLYVDSQGTGFGVQEVEGIFGLSKKFFASPVAEKATCTIQSDNRGWSGIHSESLDPENQRMGDYKEAMNIGEFTPSSPPEPQQPLPPSLTPHTTQLSTFSALCAQTCNQILTLLALGLEIPPSFFTTRHNPGPGSVGGGGGGGGTGSILRLLYYPASTSTSTSSASTAQEKESSVRAGAHSDYGSITLLFQREGQPGLEILSPDEEWVSVPVTPRGWKRGMMPPILVNIGDLLSYWTDGLLKSTVHRVVRAGGEEGGGRDRYSVVYFCHPVNEAELVPVPSRVVEEFRENKKGQEGRGGKVGFGGGAGSLEPGKRALTAKEHLESRLDATYGFRKRD